MFVNKLNQLYKPYRLLYYYEASPEEIRNFREGIVPEMIGNTRVPLVLTIMSAFSM